MIRQLINVAHKDVINTSAKKERVINSIESLLPKPFPYCFSFDLDLTQSDIDNYPAFSSRAVITQKAPFNAQVQWFMDDGTVVLSNNTIGHTYRRPGLYTVTCCMDQPLTQISSLGIPYTAINYPDFSQMDLTGYDNRSTGGLPPTKQTLYPSPPPFPGWQNMNTVFLNGGSINDVLPTWIDQMAVIFTFSFAPNPLIPSPLPVEFYNMTTVVNVTLVAGNITGSISPSITNLTSLQRFYLNINQLSGSLPASISTMTTITEFAVDRNLLTGIVPSFVNATNLSILSLWNNTMTMPANLVGPANTAIKFVFVQNMGLIQAQVDSVLANVNSAGTSNGILNIGGSNATPTGGPANPDVVALQGRGWTVAHS